MNSQIGLKEVIGSKDELVTIYHFSKIEGKWIVPRSSLSIFLFSQSRSRMMAALKTAKEQWQNSLPR